MSERTIRSEIAARVLRIEAKAGDVIAPDDAIMTLESMKMEIPVLAPARGRLVKILVAPGDEVREGQDLATFDPR